MAFSGQYAAAQLEKLDRSPLFRGNTFSLVREISDYLGYAPDFAPPSFVRWARAHGRLPCIEDDVYDEYVRAPMRVCDFFTNAFDGTIVSAQFFDPDNFALVGVIGSPEMIRNLTNQNHALFRITVAVDFGAEDMAFSQRWNRSHMSNWPHTADGIHPAISGAVRIYNQHHTFWMLMLDVQARVRGRHNRRQV